MAENSHATNWSKFCKFIEVLNPCMDDYLYIYDIKEDFYEISPGALERFQISSNRFHNVVEGHRAFVYEDDIDLILEDLQQVISGKKDFHNLQYRWKDPEGKPIWINCRGRVIKDSEGKPEFLVGCINEIGAKQKADNTSGLLGESSLKAYLHEADMEVRNGYILRLGIDNFKEINENKGIEYGDIILKKTAECIEAVMLPEQKLYRVVADEFAIVDFQGNSIKSAQKQYKKICQKIEEFIEQNCYEAVYTISGGILNCNQIQSFLSAMKLSEFALNEAKRRGKNQVYVFEEKDYQEFLRKKELLRSLRYAIYNDCQGFEVYFQPIVNAETGKLASAETLLRFQSEQTGFLSPAEFIPLLEETGLIIPVGKWVLEQACAKCSEIHKYIPDFRVSVNLSYVQVKKSNVLKDIIKMVEKYQLDPHKLIIELTESGFLESDANFRKLCAGLKEAGIALALDDFGTGYSNFHYLYDLNPNIIKIDRSFTVKALRNEYEHGLLEHIIQMIHSIELRICIEGIETDEELNKINHLGPDYIQGYFFGKPCPYDVFYEKHIKQAEMDGIAHEGCNL